MAVAAGDQRVEPAEVEESLTVGSFEGSFESGLVQYPGDIEEGPRDRCDRDRMASRSIGNNEKA